MIDSVRLKRLLGVAAALSLLASAGAIIAGAAPLAGGFGLGFVLGALPFASWAWVFSRGPAGARSRVLAVVLLATKMAIYAGALYLFVTTRLVSPIGVLIGITAVVATVSIGVLLPPAPAKGAA